MPRPPAPPSYQRNALAPGILAAVFLVVGVAFLNAGIAFLVVQYVVAILALIVAWFAVQARQWWWAPVFVAIAVLWNPVLPFGFTGPAWAVAQFVAAIAFLAAGAVIRTERAATASPR